MEELRLSKDIQKKLEEFKKAYKEWEIVGDKLFNCKAGSVPNENMYKYSDETVIGIALNHAMRALQQDMREIEELLKEREKYEATEKTDAETEADYASTCIDSK